MKLPAYEPDILDEIVASRAQSEPEVAQNWEAIKLVTRLKVERERRGLSQAQIAERMGIAQPHVARIERRPWSASLGRIMAYAHAIGVTVEVSDSSAAAA